MIVLDLGMFQVKHKMLTFMHSELSHTDVSSSPQQFLRLLCRMVDQLLFLMVEWARNSSFFKDIKVHLLKFYVDSDVMSSRMTWGDATIKTAVWIQ